MKCNGDTLYLDTARIGQISPAAASACRAAHEAAANDPRKVFSEIEKRDESPSSLLPHWRGVSGLRRSILDCMGVRHQRRLLFASASPTIARLAAPRYTARKVKKIMKVFTSQSLSGDGEGGILLAERRS